MRSLPAPSRRSPVLASVVLLVLIGDSGTALAQRPPVETTEFWLSGGARDAFTAGVLTLIVGGLLVLFGRAYADRITNRARRRPVRSFGIGFAAFIMLLGLIVFTALVPPLLIVMIPALFAFVVVAILGSVFGELAIGRSVVDGWGAALLVAAVVAAITGGVPVLGGIFGFVIGTTGLGAVLDDLLSDGGGGSAIGSGRSTPSEARHRADERY